MITVQQTLKTLDQQGVSADTPSPDHSGSAWTFDIVRLRKLRKRAGHSRRSLASAVGVCEATVGRWEQGRTEPSASQLGHLAGLLGVKVGQFYRAAERAA